MIRDLTDPTAGPHAMQLVVAAIEAAMPVPVRHDPGPRVVSIEDNYDRLRYDRDAATRDARYSRYLGDGRMLRSHTTARIPALLDDLDRDVADQVLSVPGICYRRDVIDRSHVGEPHQMDLWRVRTTGPALTGTDLTDLIGRAIGAVLPGRKWHTVPSEHPYTTRGREIYVGDVEVGECGLAHPGVLGTAATSGLAMGLGLDRLTMLAKGIPDIRLLRSADPRVAGQLLDLGPYREVSAMPPTSRDLSLVVDADLDAELLGDRVREVPGTDAVEEVVVRAETGYAGLPPSARERMGVRPGQKNVLLRVVIRDPVRTVTAAEANELRDRIYAALHEGGRHEWAVPKDLPTKLVDL
jgi:phenylalanyl-tRNA synthetase alpha chain